MSQLYRFSEYRKSPRRVFFDRAELNQLLSLYSRNVASGEWRDYAIDQVGGSAIFSVFRHTHMGLGRVCYQFPRDFMEQAASASRV